MKTFFRNKLTAFCAALSLLAAGPAAADQVYDLVIYGGTSASIASAVQAKKMGKSVIVVSPDKHLGGLSSAGLGWTDTGDHSVIGGVSREFYQRVKKYYDDKATWKWQDPSKYSRYRPDSDAQWTFEPHIAEKVFEDWVREHEIPVVRDEWLDRENGVKKNNGRIESITTLSGKTYRGRMFLDTTYEGDLYAAAGVSYTVGREANSQYNETLNGVQIKRAVSHQFTNKIDPYVKPGDPSSGLLPRVHDGSPGVQGEADKRLQAFNFRVCMTNNPENRVPFPKPEGYDPFQYELLLRDLEAGSRHIFGKFDPLPNHKTDTNNHGSFSTDNIGMNYDYPEASYERRREIIAEHEQYQKGYHYFLANDPRVPEDVRERYSKWGLAKDEFQDNGHWPHQLYIREARRMVSDFVVTENHLTRKIPTERSVGMGSYNMDSHNTQRYVDANGHVRNEGDVQVGPGGPYPIDYGALAPKKAEAENLLVPVCVSCSHIAYGSIRMEPVFMILGQSAATAAAMAIDEEIAVQDVDYAKLRERLLADGQVLEKVNAFHPDALPGVVVDDADAKQTGEWETSAALRPYVGRGYSHDGDDRSAVKKLEFATDLPKAGRYEVRLAYVPSNNRATNALVTVTHKGGKTETRVNQQEEAPLKHGFISLGTFEFAGGEKASVEVSNEGANGHVIADAVQFLPVE